jgi:hypothetical protein
MAFCIGLAGAGRACVAQQDVLLPLLEPTVEPWDPSRVPQIGHSADELRAAKKGVERFLAGRTSQENQRRWQSYLLLDEIDRLLADDMSPGEREQLLNRIAIRLRRNTAGLELPAISRWRAAVDQYEQAVREDAGRTNQSALVDAQVDRLSETLRAPVVDSALMSDYASRIAQLISDARQRPKLLSALRRTHSHSNLVVAIDSGLLSRAASRAVDETQPVRETILGTRFVGTGTLRGGVEIEPIECFDRAQLMVRLVGSFDSRNRGYNGPVQLQSTGHANVHATKILTFDGSEIQTTMASVTGELESKLLSIEHPMRLVRKIAAKRAARQKAQVNAIASSRMRRRIAEQFDGRVQEQLAQRDRQPRITTVLSRLGLSEPKQHWSSDRMGIRFAGTFADATQLGAPQSAPQIQPGAATIQVHETLVHNLSTPLFAGRTMNNTQLRDLIRQLGIEPAAEEPDDEPFTVRFARLRPIVFEARGGKLRIGIRGASFQRADQSIQRPLEVTAVYLLKAPPQTAAYLEREGDLQIVFPGREQLSWQEAGLKAAIRKSFARAFPERALEKPIEFSQMGQGGLRLNFENMIAGDGWLSLRFRP